VLNFPPAVHIWLASTPVDLRKSFDSLAEQVRQHLHNDPLSGHIFVFRNKRGDRVKLLYWDEDGFVIVYKRLEEGIFRWPAVAVGQPSVALRAAELSMLLDGIDWQKAQRGRRYHRPATAAGSAG
jgi:transposase